MGVFCAFHRDYGFSSSIVFGCTEDTRESIAARLENSESASYHPMLITGILAEMERDRHIGLVERHVYSLLDRVYALSNEGAISENSKLGPEHYPINSWVRVSQLRKGLLTWKGQLRKMIDHIAELEDNIKARGGRGEGDGFESEGTRSSSREFSPSWRGPCLRAGRRIRKRLLEIVDEYDEKIRECSIVIDGVSLAAQMVGSLASHGCWLVHYLCLPTNFQKSEPVLESYRLPGSPIQLEDSYRHSHGF